MKKNILTKIILTLELVFEILLTFSMCVAAESYKQEGKYSDVTFSYVLAGVFTLFAVATIYGFYMCSKGKSYVILVTLGFKFLIFIAGLGASSFPLGDPNMSFFFWGIDLMIIGSIWLVVKYGGTLNAPSTHSNLENLEDFRFKVYKAKWTWDETAEEYCRIQGKSIEELTDYDNEKIYYYSCNPMSYFLQWIIKNDFCSAIFYEEHDEDSIRAVKIGIESPNDFMMSDLDYGVFREDFSEEILGFVDFYYKVHFDEFYNKLMLSKGDIIYCIDYSYDIYTELERELDKRYRYYSNNEYDEDLYENMEEHNVGDITCEKLAQDIMVFASDRASDEYIEECKQQVIAYTDDFLKNMFDRLSEVFELDEYAYDTEKVEYLKENIGEASIIIPTPNEKEIAYILGFEAEFEPEHGVGIAVRNGKLVDISYRMDVDNPWSYSCELKYMKMMEQTDDK